MFERPCKRPEFCFAQQARFAAQLTIHNQRTGVLLLPSETRARAGSGVVEGVRGGTALLHRWFALVREKRGPKLEFLKALVRTFDVSTSLAATQEDVDFARYIAENFAAFDYKTRKEVLLVVKTLTNVLSTAGMQCVEALSPGHLRAQLQAPTAPQPPPSQIEGPDASMPDATAPTDLGEQGKKTPPMSHFALSFYL
jgi:hypothetical protein